jgi:hypothetical protein
LEEFDMLEEAVAVLPSWDRDEAFFLAQVGILAYVGLTCILLMTDRIACGGERYQAALTIGPKRKKRPKGREMVYD